MNIVRPKAICSAGDFVLNANFRSVESLTITDGRPDTDFENLGRTGPKVAINPPLRQNEKRNRQPEPKTAKQKESAKEDTLPYPGDPFGSGSTITTLFFE